MYWIDEDTCTGCGTCLNVCSAGAIYMVDNKADIDEKRCIQCGACVGVCPNNAIEVKEFVDTSPEPARKRAQTWGFKPTASATVNPLLFTALSKLKDLLWRPPVIFGTGPRRVDCPRRGRGYRRRCWGRTRKRW